MQRWSYQTLVVRIGRDDLIEVLRVNDKEAQIVEPGGILKSPRYQDLYSYLGRFGQEGWEVVGVAPLTTQIPASGTGEGKVRVMIILKRPAGESVD